MTLSSTHCWELVTAIHIVHVAVEHVTVTDVPTASLFAYQFCRVGLPLFPVPDLILDLKSIALVIRSIFSILFRLAHSISMEKFSAVMTIFP
jgi:hypothetical protein